MSTIEELNRYTAVLAQQIEDLQSQLTALSNRVLELEANHADQARES